VAGTQQEKTAEQGLKPHSFLELCRGAEAPLFHVLVGAQLSSVRENLSQFLRGDNFQLSIGAVHRLLIVPPSAELRSVTKTIPLHVVVRNFHNQLWAQWFPREVFSLTPSTLAARHALRLVAIGFSVFGPRLPRMRCEGIFAIRSQEVHQLLAFRGAEAGTHSNVLQCAGVIEKTQQQ
jgi:hypothetical protein